MKNYLNRYMATCVPGMESVVEDEIREVLKGTNNITIMRGKVTFDCPLASVDFNGFKCIDNLYKLFRIFKIGGHKEDLTSIGPCVADIDFEMDIQAPYSTIVSASRSGKHTYSRYDVENQIKNALVATGRYTVGNNANHALAIRTDVVGDSCSIYKQLTSSQMRFRGDFLSAPGGIRPPIAHCLVRLSSPKSGDVFYDPFCGAGTIPFERSYYKSKRIYASDMNGDVVENARTNLKQAAIVFTADATSTTMKDRSVNTIVTNMPWGKQIVVDDISRLYRDFMRELKRILAADGKAIILTDQVSTVSHLCDEFGFRCSRLAELSLHGLRPIVFLLRPNQTDSEGSYAV